VRPGLLDRRPVAGLELPVAGGLLLVLGAAVWGSHVVNGGFYWADDWLSARLYLFPDTPGVFGNVNHHTAQFRPVLGVLLAAPFRLFGLRPDLHILLGIVLSVLASASFYWLLRTMGLERVHAFAVSGLALIFPWADTSRLWITATVNNWAVIFYFTGLTLALIGLRSEGLRKWLLGAVALALWVLGCLTYEVIGPPALLSVLVYAWWAGWRRALLRWPFDVVGVGAALVHVWLNQPEHHTDKPTLGEQAAHAWRIVAEGTRLLWSALIPAQVSPDIAAVLTGMLLAAAGAALLRLPLRDEARAVLHRWVAITAAGVVATGVSYAAFVPGLAKYVPTAEGILNRVNILGAFGYSVVVYGLLMLAATLIACAARRGPAVATGIAMVFTVAIAAGYIARDAHDKRLWARGWELERLQLSAVADLVPHPPPHAVIYSFGIPNYVGPGVPIFALGGDFRSAVKVTLRNPHVGGIPMRRVTRWVCRKSGMHPEDYFLGEREGVPYGLGYFLDVRRRRVVVIRSEAACRHWSRALGNPPADEPGLRRLRRYYAGLGRY
jgi:hypothetical protein